jgi:hypothetical protein
MGNRLAPEKLNLARVASDAGVLVVSTGAAERCISTATMLNLTPAGLPYAKGGIVGINVDAYVIKSDFADHQGTLSVFELKPGNYQLYPSIMNPYVTPSKIPKAEFSIAAGEVLYIGEFFMPISCNWGNATEFRDQEVRDMKLLLERNPQFAEKPTTKRIAKFTGYILGAEK